MSGIAIKTEKLDDEQDELGMMKQVVDEDGVSSQEHGNDTSSADVSNAMAAGKQRPGVGRNANIVLLHQQQRHQPQIQAIPLLKGGRGLGSSSARFSEHENSNSKKSTLPKSRCGEVFVSDNARQWTFICSYCNKSTRDIGEFICHIKMKHLGGFVDEAEETDDGGGSQETNFYDQDQDYLDCGSYLDVNVHTDPEEYNFNGQDHSARYRNTGSNNTPRPPAVAAKEEIDIHKKQKSGVEIVSIENENERTAGTTKESAAQWRADPANFQSYAYKQSNATSTLDIKIRDNVTANGSTGIDDNDYAATKDGFNKTTGYDNDEEDDFDNQLLIAPNDSLDASTLGGCATGSAGGEMKTKRRQIRGTAYCALCNKTFQYYSLYRNHMIKHSNETPFKCPICKKGFKSKQAIRYHMNTHQKDKQFKCTVCSASYGTENHFITHIMTHESATAFPCMVCGQVLTSSKERDLHMIDHKEERPFRCDYCNKLFRLRHHLSNHLKMHRKYRCDYCKEIFTSAIYLRKPYACPGCENSPDAQQDAAQSTGARRDGRNINPLEIFETVITPGQEQTADYAQMVTDSEGDDDDDDDDNDDVLDGQQRESMDEDDGEDDDNAGRDDNQEEEGDDEEEYEDDDEPRSGGGDGSSQLNSTKRYECKYCERSYSHPSGLNYHIRHKHC